MTVPCVWTYNHQTFKLIKDEETVEYFMGNMEIIELSEYNLYGKYPKSTISRTQCVEMGPKIYLVLQKCYCKVFLLSCHTISASTLSVMNYRTIRFRHNYNFYCTNIIHILKIGEDIGMCCVKSNL
ncbi:hypothetical protein H8356DRAFT_1351082 [Neocallimastix lanati (nom. inval.)]|nr:hypothetical protein H8356DRAFT_1351082 [Neocallimastix sp. JGI-2020a]